MRKQEFYPEFRDLFQYNGSNEIERIRIKGGRTVPRDWFVFESVDTASIFLANDAVDLKGGIIKGIDMVIISCWRLVLACEVVDIF